MQNIVVERLPALVSQLGEMQTFLRAASSTEAVSSAQATRLALLDTSIRIRSTIDGVKSDLEAAYRGNADGSVRRNIDAAIMTMIASVESYLSTIELGSPDAEGKVDPASLEDAFSSAVESTIRAWAIVQADLERLLKVRITELGWKLHMSLALIGLLVGLSILLAAMTHQHIVSSLGHLEGIVAKVRELKPSNLGSDQHTGEEFGKLTVAFNNMLAELAAAREREIADQVPICPTDVADDDGSDGSFDRSRTQPAAGRDRNQRQCRLALARKCDAGSRRGAGGSTGALSVTVIVRAS